jgi:hypothetical protein
VYNQEGGFPVGIIKNQEKLVMSVVLTSMDCGSPCGEKNRNRTDVDTSLGPLCPTTKMGQPINPVREKKET